MSLRATQVIRIASVGFALALLSHGSHAQTSTPQRLPDKSVVSVDVIGIKLGSTSVTEARAIIEKVTPKLHVEDVQRILKGKRSGGRVVDIPNTQYVSQLRTTTASIRAARQNCDSDGWVKMKEDCEQIDIQFSSPPNQGTAIAIKRHLFFLNGPAVDKVIASVIEKYGKPSMEDASGDQAVRTLSWAWMADGKQMALQKVGSSTAWCNYVSMPMEITDSPGMAPLNGLQQGCAAVLKVELRTRNAVVRHMIVTAADLYHGYRFNVATIRAVNDLITKLDQAERDKASKSTAPRL